jgi:hypothetical protein
MLGKEWDGRNSENEAQGGLVQRMFGWGGKNRLKWRNLRGRASFGKVGLTVRSNSSKRKQNIIKFSWFWDVMKLCYLLNCCEISVTFLYWALRCANCKIVILTFKNVWQPSLALSSWDSFEQCHYGLFTARSGRVGWNCVSQPSLTVHWTS